MSAILKPYDNISIDTTSDDTLTPASALRLHSVAAKKIFYCFCGRNAWYATWVQIYSPDCMHLTIESAKEHAERKRVQGSVFYIEELPALELDAGPYRIYLTQINSSCPLKEYRCDAVRKHLRFDQNFIGGARDRYLVLGASVERAVLSFNYDSRFWLSEQPPQNSIMFLYTKGEIPGARLTTTPLKAWVSSSVGNNYYLNWHRKDSKRSGRSVLRITKQAGLGGRAV